MPRPQFSLKTLLWLTVVVAAFCAGTQLDRYLEEHRADPRETSIRAALDEKTVLDVAEQPFVDVIEYLKARHEIEIQLDHKALADAGISSEAAITRSVKGITLRSALKLLLSDLDLTYVVQNGTLIITTKTEARSTLLSLKSLLWLMAVLAVFLVGIQLGRKSRPHNLRSGQSGGDGIPWARKMRASGAPPFDLGGTPHVDQSNI